MRKNTSNKSKSRSAKKRFGGLKGHPFVLPVVIFMVLFFGAIVGFVAMSGTTVGATDTRVVSLSIDGEEQTIPTRADTVKDLLKRLNIQLDPEDIVKPDLDTAIQYDNFSIDVYNARPVLVIDGEERNVAYTAEPTAEGVAKAVGIDVHPEDRLETVPADTMSATDFLKEGVVAERLIIDRATVANLNLYGTPVTVRTHAETVGELLEEKEVKLNEGDTLKPDASTKLTPGAEIFVIRVGKEVVQATEEIAPPVEYVDDFNLTLGSTKVQDPGKPGTKLVTYEIEEQNGVEVTRKIIQEVVTAQPVKQVVARGRMAPVVAGNKAEIMSAAGIPSSQHYAADFIISHESGWRVNALNSRGCAGLGQACPGSKLARVCPNWQSDPVCQMRFFNGYAVGRYGSWNRAFEVWQLQRWW